MPTLPSRTLLKCVLLLAILLPLVSLSQVKIKEKVEIKPQTQTASKRGAASTTSLGRFFNPPFFVWDTLAHQPYLTLSANVTVQGTVTFGADIDCGQYAKVYFGNYDIVNRGKTSSGSGCTPYYNRQPFVGDLSRASYPDVQMFTFDWQTADGVRVPMSGDESSISYSFSSYLRQGILPTSPPDVQVTATATATGNYFVPLALFDHWELRDNQTVLACNGSMGIIMSPSDGYGEPYSPVGISGYEAPVIVRVDSGGPYVFLRALGKEDTVVATTLSDGCTLVFDSKRGGFSGDTKDVLVTVTGGGKSASFVVTLMCQSYNHLEVTASPRVLAAVDTSTVRVVARDINNQEVNSADGHMIMMSLSSPDVVLPPPSRWGPPQMPPLGNFVVQGGNPQPPPIIVAYSVAKSGDVKYVPDTAMFGSRDSIKVIISAQDMSDMSKKASTDLKVVKNTVCVHVAFDTSRVAPGGTTGLQFTKADGTGGFPADQLFDVLIVSGGGALVSSTDSGSVLIGTQAPVRYVAPAAIAGDSMVVGVSALAYSSGGGTPAGSQVSVAPVQNMSNLKKLSGVAATQSVNKKAREAQIAAIARLLEDNQCPLPAVLVVTSDLLDHFAVTVIPDSIRHDESAIIKIQGKDKENNDIEPSADTKVHVTIPSDDVYANLVYEGAKAKSITEVPYADAKTGKVTIVADGEDPVNLGPQKITIGATKVGKESTAGSGTLKLKPSIDKFCQNGDWGGQPYDTYKELDNKGDIRLPEHQMTIADVGCAQTCMAMILNAVGLNYNPSTLNQQMTADGYFTKNRKNNWNGGVDWRAVTDYGNKYISGAIDPLGDDSNWRTKTPIDISQLDASLQSKSFVVVLVGNPSRNDPTKISSHWVLVTGKQNGEYQILDPGCFSDPRTTLGNVNYANKIYRAIIYGRKPQ